MNEIRKLRMHLPGTIPEIADKTGWPYATVRRVIADAREIGVIITAYPDEAQQTVFAERLDAKQDAGGQ